MHLTRNSILLCCIINNLHYSKYIVPVAPVKGNFNFLLFWSWLIWLDFSNPSGCHEISFEVPTKSWIIFWVNFYLYTILQANGIIQLTYIGCISDELLFQTQSKWSLTPWTQDIIWTSYVCPNYVLCPGGSQLVKPRKN